MAKSIPYVGEIFTGDFPAVRKCAHITYGASTTNDVPMAAQAVYTLFDLPAGCVLLGAKNIVTTAFTASVTITIGDSDAAAGYFASATIAPQTAVTTGLLTAAGGASAAGKTYTVAQPLTATVGVADVAAGKGELFLEYALAGLD